LELLLVEDESSVISLIQRGLKYEDFQITVANDHVTSDEWIGCLPADPQFRQRCAFHVTEKLLR